MLAARTGTAVDDPTADEIIGAMNQVMAVAGWSQARSAASPS
jgi:alkylhydroperoxidase/carboxymuconolactone decarboxylase family protein YurZ